MGTKIGCGFPDNRQKLSLLDEPTKSRSRVLNDPEPKLILNWKILCYQFQTTFLHHSHFWKDRNTYQDAAGKNGFDLQETKLPTYWKTPFSKICLGMRIGQQLSFIVINKTADSFYSLIADGKYRATSLGRDTWKKVVGSQASLQRNCNKEGFNVECGSSKARIGITSNQEIHCSSCDSSIGFGTRDNSCGNVATHMPNNGNKHIRAMGYILVHWQGIWFTFKLRSRYRLEEK